MMIDLSSAEDVLRRVKQASLAFQEDGPSYYDVMSGIRSVPTDRLPEGIAELLNEIADVLSESSPFETGVPASSWLLIEKRVPAVVAGITANGPPGYYKDAREAVESLHGGFQAAARRQAKDARRQSPPKGRVARVLRSRRMPIAEIARRLVPGERILLAWRTEAGVVVVVTEERVVLAARGHDAPQVVWSGRHDEITVEISHSIWRILWSGGRDAGGRIRLSSSHNTAELAFSAADKSEAELLYSLWSRQRAKLPDQR